MNRIIGTALIKLADNLDKRGFTVEATVIDNIIKEAMDFTSITPVLETKPLNDRELQRAIRLSISAEHDAIHSYELIADSIEDEKIKKIFQDIANEEKVHVGEFERVLQTLDTKDASFVEEGNIEVLEMLEE